MKLPVHSVLAPIEVVDHIVAKSDGVPLYVEELTKAILGSGVLEARGDVYVLTGALAQFTSRRHCRIR